MTGWTGSWNNEYDTKSYYIVDPVADTIRIGGLIPLEFRRGAAGVAVYNDVFYITQGANNGHQKKYGGLPYNGFTRFTPATGEWEALGQIPAYNRDHFRAALIGSHLFLVAGRDTTKSNEAELCCGWLPEPIEYIDLSDLDNDVWHEGAPVPFPLCGHGLVVDEDRGDIIIFGGESDYNVYAGAIFFCFLSCHTLFFMHVS